MAQSPPNVAIGNSPVAAARRSSSLVGISRRRGTPSGYRKRIGRYIVLLASATCAAVVLSGCGDVVREACGVSIRPGEYACTDGSRPRDWLARDCESYGAVYRILFWHCQPDR